jgi:ABC-type polysaccharide/polyol phosphate transport system ATPase subunit
MSDIVIGVKEVSKKYHLYDSPKDRLKEALNPFGKKYHRDFYALNNINLDVFRGETLGVVGRNGSGKSTLLKIITGVLTPSTGTVTVAGKISALLELGSGVNPEYTGIENIYFNGSVMGFTREEMDAKLDDILSFADIGDFIYQPVKVYSSGMVLRLAFSVATIVEPEILIVDEALAVGDAKFQRKCYARLEEFRNSGRTILFVSHDVNVVKLLCSRAILLEEGNLINEGDARIVTRLYHKLLFGETEESNATGKEESRVDIEAGSTISEDVNVSSVEDDAATSPLEDRLNAQMKSNEGDDIIEVGNLFPERELRYGDLKAEIFDMGILDKNTKRVNLLKTGEHYTIFFRVLFHDNVDNLTFGCRIQNTKGVDIFAANTSYHQVKIPSQKKGGIVECRFDVAMNLGPGDFFLTFGIRSLDTDSFYDKRIDAFHFKVQADSYMDSACLVNLHEVVSVINIK